MLPVLRSEPTWNALAARPVNRLESLFERFFGDDFLTGDAWSWTAVPVAMWHDDDHIYIEAEIPGVKEQDVDLSVHNGMLFIRGERRPEEGRNYLYNGRSYGRFERVITLPEPVDADAVEARLTDCVLSVRLPKSPEARPRKITLKTG